MQLRSGGEHPAGIVELTDDPVVADAAEPHLGLGAERRVADEHDVALGRQRRRRPTPRSGPAARR